MPMDKQFIRDQIEMTRPKPWIGVAYRPVDIRLERNRATASLYAAEEVLAQSLNRCASYWLTACGYPQEEQSKGRPPLLWSRGIGQALYDLLDHFDADCAEAAAIAFLEKRGYAVPMIAWPEHRQDVTNEHTPAPPNPAMSWPDVCHFIAQGAVNIDGGLGDIEAGSKVHVAMHAFCSYMTAWEGRK